MLLRHIIVRPRRRLDFGQILRFKIGVAFVHKRIISYAALDCLG